MLTSTQEIRLQDSFIAEAVDVDLPLFIGRFVEGGHKHYSNLTALNPQRSDNVPYSVVIRHNVVEIDFFSNTPARLVCSRYTEDWGWCLQKYDGFLTIIRSFDRRHGFRDELGRLHMQMCKRDAFEEVMDANAALFGSHEFYQKYAA